MKQLSIFVLFFFLSLVLTVSAYAHSGCCSWHGGVRADGCGCNDGTPLSSTCAPYYTCNAPQVNTAPATSNSTYQPPVYVAPTDTPTPIPPTDTPTPLPTATPKPQPTATPAPVKKIPTPTIAPTAAVLGASTNSGTGGVVLLLLAAGIIGGSLWWGRKLISTKNKI